MSGFYYPRIRLHVVSFSSAVVFCASMATASHATIVQQPEPVQATSLGVVPKLALAETETKEEEDKDGAKSKEKEQTKDKDKAKAKSKSKAKQESEKERPETVTERLQRQLSAELSLHDERLRKKYLELNDEYQRLQWENQLVSERLTQAKLKRDEANVDVVAEYEAKVATITREKELLTEELALTKLKVDVAESEAVVAYEKKLGELEREKKLLSEQLERDKLVREIETQDERIKHEESLAKMQRETESLQSKVMYLTAKFEAQDTESKIEISKLESELMLMNAEKKRQQYVKYAPQYLENPLQEDGTLIISDRRIALNGAITSGSADFVSERINFFNNKNSKHPIFIVIDSSPGGSVLEGLRIIRAMQGSEAPIHVVVKSLAASMAATITAMAERSYAYPNAYFVHHQISTIFFGRLNLSQKKEFYENAKKLWVRVATPVAEKMGITSDEFVAKMYENSLAGDWIEFGTEAQKLKWVDHIVESVKETSLIVNPDLKSESSSEDVEAKWSSKEVQLDEQGKPYTFLPRLFPHDYYYIYNPDSYYRVR